jgi:hypothetical protein
MVYVVCSETFSLQGAVPVYACAKMFATSLYAVPGKHAHSLHIQKYSSITASESEHTIIIIKEAEHYFFTSYTTTIAEILPK